MAPISATGHIVPCLPWDDLIESFAERYKEAPTAGGIIGEGTGSVVLFSTKNGETWTIVRRTRNVNGCLVAAGKDWTEFKWRLPMLEGDEIERTPK